MTTAPTATAMLLSSTLLAWSTAAGGSALRAAEGDGVQQALTNQLVNTLSLSPNIDLATVAKVKFFVTTDGGRTWALGQETAVPAGAKERPRFQLAAPRDGVYGIMTSVTYRQGRSAEAEPRPGQPPSYAVVVDTTPPTVVRFEATLIGASADKALVRCAWATSDAHPATEAVGIEASADGGAHFTTVQRGPAEGAADLAVPLPAGVKQLQVRLSAIDLAKNQVATPVRLLNLAAPGSAQSTTAAATTPAAAAAQPATTTAASAATAAPATTPVTTAVPANTTPPAAAAAPGAAAASAAAVPAAPNDPLAELAQAAKGVPPLSEFDAGPRPPLPEIAPVAQDHPPKPKPEPTVVPAPVPAAAPTPQAAPPAAATTATAKRPDVVVAGEPPRPAGDDRPLAGTNAVDQEFYRKLAELHPADAPATPGSRVAPRPVPSTARADDQRGTRDRDDAEDAPRSAPAAAPARRAAPPAAPAPQRVVDGQRQRPEPAPFMDAVAATQGLTDARIAARVGNADDACDFYERLRTSGLAKLAALEEAQLLLRERRPLDALTAIGSLPPELMTDAVRVEHGRALLATGHPDQAFATLSRIGGKAPESRAALLLIGRCYRAQDKADEARKVFEFLAKGGDQVAAEASAELGRAGR